MKFTKHDQGKARLDLLPPEAIELVGFVLGHGARKYAPNNWRKCKDPQRYIAAMLRHAFLHLRGEPVDADSGLLHLAHAVCSGLFALEIFVRLGEDSDPVTVKQFSYFAVIERKPGSLKRGVVRKRFRSYSRAWAYMSGANLDLKKFVVQTIKPCTKIGHYVTLG